jgi:hypothetical protein
MAKWAWCWKKKAGRPFQKWGGDDDLTSFAARPGSTELSSLSRPHGAPTKMGNRWTAGQEEGKEAGEGNSLEVEWSGKAKAQS